MLSDVEKRTIRTGIFIYLADEVYRDLIAMDLKASTKPEEVLDYVRLEANNFIRRMGYNHPPLVDVDIINGQVSVKVFWPEDEQCLH